MDPKKTDKPAFTRFRDEPLITVTMPVYNAGPYVGRSIESILNQDYTNFELIIINDASTDNSREVILSYQDPRIRYYENEKNSGIVYTRNRCLSYAKGEYIAVLDSDDIALPHRLSTQLAYLQAHPENSMCGTFFNVIDGNDQFVESVKYPDDFERIRTYMLFNNCFCHSTVMIRNRPEYALHYTEGYDIIEDYEMFYRLSKVSRISNIPEVTTLYRIHGNNISVAKMNTMYERIMKMNARILAQLGIPFTEEELRMHSYFLTTNISYFKPVERIQALQEWLRNLLKNLKEDSANNRKIILKNLMKRWMVICLKNGHYSRFLFSSLVLKHKAILLQCIFDKIRLRLKKSSFGNDF